MDEFQEFCIKIQLFDQYMNSFLNKIWIELDRNLTIDHSGKWWGELGRYNEKLMRKPQNHISLAFDNYHKVREVEKRSIIRHYSRFYTYRSMWTCMDHNHGIEIEFRSNFWDDSFSFRSPPRWVKCGEIWSFWTESRHGTE